MLPKIANSIKQVATTNVVTKYPFKLKFDGCSKGNPGLAGAGAVIYLNDDDTNNDNDLEEIWATSQFIGTKATNNEAEYSGLIIGLKKAIELNDTELCFCIINNVQILEEYQAVDCLKYFLK